MIWSRLELFMYPSIFMLDRWTCVHITYLELSGQEINIGVWRVYRGRECLQPWLSNVWWFENCGCFIHIFLSLIWFDHILKVSTVRRLITFLWLYSLMSYLIMIPPIVTFYSVTIVYFFLVSCSFVAKSVVWLCSSSK